MNAIRSGQNSSRSSQKEVSQTPLHRKLFKPPPGDELFAVTFEESLAKALDLELWEFRLWMAMRHLRASLNRKNTFGLLTKVFNLQDADDISVIPPAHLDVSWATIQASFAAELGQFIADELLRPNYQVLRIAAEGWENLNSGKPFKKKPGKPVNRMCVYQAWSDVAILSVDRLPSLDEIIAELAKQTPPVRMPKSQVIRVIEAIGLKGFYRDTRRADEDPKRAM